MNDWLIKIGVKNQIGNTINKNKKKHIMNEDKFFDLTFLFSFAYNGDNTIARITPTIIESKIGFRRKNARIKSTARIKVIVIFLKYGSSIFYRICSKNKFIKLVNKDNVYKGVWI